MTKVICIGSGSNMTLINQWDTDGMVVVGVNNTWRGTDKWDHMIHPLDYPHKNKITKTRNQQQIHSREGDKGFKKSYMGISKMPWQQARIYLGLPIYFTSTYWALWHLKPSYIGYIGFDMNYTPKEDGSTTFYGVGHDMKTRGVPDPLYQFRTVPEYKNDPDPFNTLLNRLDEYRGSTELYNLSDDPDSLLPWKKISFEQFKAL